MVVQAVEPDGDIAFLFCTDPGFPIGNNPCGHISQDINGILGHLSCFSTLRFTIGRKDVTS
jgi:hypothetical protein